jgi:hypothetical protein
VAGLEIGGGNLDLQILIERDGTNDFRAGVNDTLHDRAAGVSLVVAQQNFELPQRFGRLNHRGGGENFEDQIVAAELNDGTDNRETFAGLARDSVFFDASLIHVSPRISERGQDATADASTRCWGAGNAGRGSLHSYNHHRGAMTNSQ